MDRVSGAGTSRDVHTRCARQTLACRLFYSLWTFFRRRRKSLNHTPTEKDTSDNDVPGKWISADVRNVRHNVQSAAKRFDLDHVEGQLASGVYATLGLEHATR